MPIVDSHFARIGIAKSMCTVVMLLLSFIILYRNSQRQIDESDRQYAAKSVQWMKYSNETRDALLSAGKRVVVFVYAELAPESAMAFRNFDARKLADVCGGSDCEALLLRYDNWSDPSIRSVWNDIWHTKYPFVVRYSPNAAAVAFDPCSLEPLESPRYR